MLSVAKAHNILEMSCGKAGGMGTEWQLANMTNRNENPEWKDNIEGDISVNITLHNLFRIKRKQLSQHVQPVE